MELKNQILLVILIPIILILLLAVLQVGLLGFVSIPSFQDSLLEFHINRHINGLTIEMNIIEQEIYIQYQAYFNQIFGLSAHLRHYSFGEFQNYSNWTLDNKAISPYSLVNAESLSDEYKISWSHDNYDNLDELKAKNGQLMFRITKAAQSLTLADIIINNTRSLKQDLKLNDTPTDTGNKSESSDLVPINYAAIMIHCSDSLVVRFPAFPKEQQEKLIGYNVRQWLPKTPFYLDNTLNFTMKYDQHDQFTPSPSIELTQIVFQDDTMKCYMTAKILNTYLEDLTVRHFSQHQGQGETEHQLFTAIVDGQFTTIAPSKYQNRNLSSSIVRYIMDSKGMSDSSEENLLDRIEKPILQGIKDIQTNSSMNSTMLSIGYGDYKFYLLISEVVTYSTKKVSIVTAPENGRRYVFIEPETNNYTMQTLILVHYFEESVLIQELYDGTSLNNVRILEIIVLIVIIVLSVVIFLFVWYTATRIGLSFEQPIKVLTEFMNNIDIQNMDQEEELINYQDYFNSFEIKSLFQTMNIFVTTIKYSNQKYSNSKHSDAIALMELSKAKDFYKKEIGNMSAVGICANNIGILHMKAGRIFEAVNEMEEAIYIAKLELIEIKELKKWCNNMQNALAEPNLYQNFKSKIKGLANKFRQQIEFNWINKYQQKQQQEGKGGSKKVSNISYQKRNTQGTKNASTTLINSKAGTVQMGFNTKNTQLFSGVPSGTTPKHNKRLVSDKNSVQSEFNVGNNISGVNIIPKSLLPINQADQESSPQISPNVSHNHQNNKSKQYFGNSYNQSSIIQSQRLDLKESMVNEDEKKLEVSDEERDRKNSNQSDGNMTELQMIGEKLAELTKKKQLVKAKLMNRQFQLAQFMFTICMQYSDVFIPETLRLFNEFEGKAEKDTKFTQSKIVRLINLHVKKALCYIQLGDIRNFQDSEKKAEEYYNKLTSEFFTQDQSGVAEEQDFNFVDMFKNVPKEVLLSKIMQLKAIYQLLQGNFRSAAEILTQIIEMGEYYDPEVRDFCLVVLENVFKLFEISTLPIQQFRNQISINVYEIVFMIDYSKDMTIEQINLSHSICTKIFSILQPQDLVGMYGFNDSLHEAFPLQPKGTYKDLLNKQLYMAITAPGGNSRLYQALRFSIKNFFEHKINISENQKSKEKQKVNQSGGNIQKQMSGIVEEKSMSERLNLAQPVGEDIDISQQLDGQETESETSDDEEYQFLSNKAQAIPNGSSKATPIVGNEQDFRNRYKFICLFTEINKQLSLKQENRIKQLLEKNQVDLMVFNIANQNANMLDLKKLSKITPRSIFVNATANLEQLFGKQRQNQLQKKMYLEFF